MKMMFGKKAPLDPNVMPDPEDMSPEAVEIRSRLSNLAIKKALTALSEKLAGRFSRFGR